MAPKQMTLGLTEYFTFYNGERPHQALGNRTPDQVYAPNVWWADPWLSPSWS